MKRIGILAYGSLIEDPGEELGPLIIERISGVRTPFSVEFARSSSRRNGAPTLVPVENGGSSVQGMILVLDPLVQVTHAEDLLWRREREESVSSNQHYTPSIKPSINKIIIERLQEVAGVETVLYTRIGANISNPTPDRLADLAISSARELAGKEHRDGISYLISIKEQSIQTPLMSEYEASILKKTKTLTLQEALSKIKEGRS